MISVIVALSLHVQCANGERFHSAKQVLESVNGAAQWHLRKFAAVGSDWESFAEQVEKNKLRGSALLEANETSPLPQTVWCPTEWRDRLSLEAEMVSEGSHGKVYVMNVECDPSQRMPVAVKVQKYKSAVDVEIDYMENLDHPNLIKAFAHAPGPGPTDISILMEIAAGGNFEKIKTVSSADQARLLLEAFQGLAYMHERSIVHSDIKPDNILLSGHCSTGSCYSKLADFGVTVKAGTFKVSGTPYYIAPEMLTSGPRVPNNDLWSMGVTIHEIFKGVLPYNFGSCDDIACFTKKLRGAKPYRRPRGFLVNKPLEELLEGLLDPNPARRLNAEGAAAICERWWLSEVTGSTEHNVPKPFLPSCWVLCGSKACPQWPRPQTCSLDERSEAVCSGDALISTTTTPAPMEATMDDDAVPAMALAQVDVPQVPQFHDASGTVLKTVLPSASR